LILAFAYITFGPTKPFGLCTFNYLAAPARSNLLPSYFPPVHFLPILSFLPAGLYFRNFGWSFAPQFFFVLELSTHAAGYMKNQFRQPTFLSCRVRYLSVLFQWLCVIQNICPFKISAIFIISSSYCLVDIKVSFKCEKPKLNAWTYKVLYLTDQSISKLNLIEHWVTSFTLSWWAKT
jgi:hypothetical protein